jgi:hypothetical protein
MCEFIRFMSRSTSRWSELVSRLSTRPARMRAKCVSVAFASRLRKTSFSPDHLPEIVLFYQLVQSLVAADVAEALNLGPGESGAREVVSVAGCTRLSSS